MARVVVQRGVRYARHDATRHARHGAVRHAARLLVVRRVFAQLRREVVGSAHHCRRKLGRGAQQPRHAQVADLDAALAEEEVARLEVAVQDLRAVQVVQAQQRLCKVPPDVVLGQQHALLPLDELTQVAAVAELHHDVQLALLAKAVVVAHDARVVQPREEPHLVQRVLLLLARGALGRHRLDNVPEAVRDARDLEHLAKRALAELPPPHEVGACHPVTEDNNHRPLGVSCGTHGSGALVLCRVRWSGGVSGARPRHVRVRVVSPLASCGAPEAAPLRPCTWSQKKYVMLAASCATIENNGTQPLIRTLQRCLHTIARGTEEESCEDR